VCCVGCVLFSAGERIQWEPPSRRFADVHHVRCTRVGCAECILNRLCVLLPAKDERLGISKTLKSILKAGVPPEDIYLIDDGSSDGTGEIAQSIGVNVLRNPKNTGKALALKRCAAAFEEVSRCDCICLMAADT